MADQLKRWREGWGGTPRVVVACQIGPVVGWETEAVLREAGIEFVQSGLLDDSGKPAQAVAEAEVLISGGGPLGADVFAAMPRARFVLRPYVGYDDVDVDAATEQGILFANVPDTFIEEVANHALALILATNRRLPRMDRFIRDGRWAGGEPARPAAHPIRRLSTMTLGLIGFGNIGRLVAPRAAPFGFRILANDPYVPAESIAAAGAEPVSLDRLLEESDIVSLHVFLWRETRPLLDAARLAQMKPTATLINTSRGPVVDEPALIQALQEGRLAAAGLDVFATEPLDPSSPLTRMENVILAPHIASYSDEGDSLHRRRVGHLALQAASGGLPERWVVVNKDLYDLVAGLPELAAVKRY